ncbi:hypothetical protein E2C01_067456 [Portunus trituberculatus]|uniref:Uncharacterized protein n=1 Tax=Portunus trituberculatus TaxID=210409 RepID=A0A5B7HWR6_PORTR|nr:hypothetical protein [Portunus trituberculatus]
MLCVVLSSTLTGCCWEQRKVFSVLMLTTAKLPG